MNIAARLSQRVLKKVFAVKGTASESYNRINGVDAASGGTSENTVQSTLEP